MSKYNSRKTTVDGFTFDSKKEANRYLELKQMEKDGLIHNLQLQVPFELIPPFEIVIDGKKRKRRRMEYIADFVYYINNVKVVEDVKGRKTEVYKIKKKIFEYKFKATIKET
nr:MAG TPA: Endonuclease [Caudoviricetes sp.]